MPQWLKLALAVVAGIIIVESKGHIFVQVGDALQSLFNATSGG
jgi:hypothetical protein